MDPKGPTPPKPRGRVKHQRRRALYSTISNTPTQLLLARIHELEGRLATVEDYSAKLVDRINLLSMAVPAMSNQLAAVDQALGWVMQTMGVAGPPDQRTEGGLILPPGVTLDPKPETNEPTPTPLVSLQ